MSAKLDNRNVQLDEVLRHWLCRRYSSWISGYS